MHLQLLTILQNHIVNGYSTPGADVDTLIVRTVSTLLDRQILQSYIIGLKTEYLILPITTDSHTRRIAKDGNSLVNINSILNVIPVPQL